MAGRKRTFGRVRKLASGRYQARYPGPDGIVRPAPHTFRTKREADDWLADKQTELRRGDWTDPEAGKVAFGGYAKTWIAQRGVSKGTAELYATLLRVHLEPALGALSVANITAADVRAWRTAKLDAGTGASTMAKSYALLRAILGTAVDDQLIRRNPCRIKGASTAPTPERPTATVAEVYAIADAMQPRYRAFVLLAAFSGLRFGELVGLRRRDLDMEGGTLRVRRSVAELRNGKRLIKEPKSAAGKRTVAIPKVIRAELTAHLQVYAEPGADGRVFIGSRKAVPRRNHFGKLWRKACDTAGIKGLHFHDLRHTGNTLAAATGASTKELMTRMGHSTARAALIYQHASAERERLIGDAVSDFVERARNQDRGPDGHAGGTRD
ncbi:site-specific integrase [Streptomyces sp. So13.3]|uniref:tyrosine-type recombinase/integrase n=1 Tax=Streptomyces sp. So13.3 TaxID=2136173 RepID=UPI0011064FC4|nr:site-specific integrase [Streptomyces sp. So13.3]QNA73426.1 site-specific integrase [Streptomyces sp. So13.3]